MEYVSGSKEENYTTSNLEELVFNSDVHRTLYCDNVSIIMMSNSNKSNVRASYIYMHHCYLK